MGSVGLVREAGHLRAFTSPSRERRPGGFGRAVPTSRPRCSRRRGFAPPRHGAEGRNPHGRRIPGEHRADSRSSDRLPRHGLAPGSKALKPSSAARRSSDAPSRVASPFAKGVAFASEPRRSPLAQLLRESGGCSQRQEGIGWPGGRPAPDEGKALKGVELHERSGMKQGRVARRGASRQEGEKPWRRNVPGEASPGSVDSTGGSCWRSRKPHERSRVRRRNTTRRPAAGHTLKGMPTPWTACRSTSCAPGSAPPGRPRGPAPPADGLEQVPRTGRDRQTSAAIPVRSAASSWAGPTP
jgi:hypothetical protein